MSGVWWNRNLGSKFLHHGQTGNLTPTAHQRLELHRRHTRGTRQCRLGPPSALTLWRPRVSALHIIAMTQSRIRGSASRTYYDKKIAEGKSPKEARRCLKRRRADRIAGRGGATSSANNISGKSWCGRRFDRARETLRASIEELAELGPAHHRRRVRSGVVDGCRWYVDSPATYTHSTPTARCH